MYGRIVLRNCGVEHFKRKDKTWHEGELKAAKKRKLLEEILEERGEAVVATKKAKPMSENNFTQLAPEMAALGFTATGKHAGDSEEVRVNHYLFASLSEILACALIPGTIYGQVLHEHKVSCHALQPYRFKIYKCTCF